MISWFAKRRVRETQLREWNELLKVADANAIEMALIYRAPRKAVSLDEVIAQLDDPEQAKVLAYWQRSRWAPAAQSASLDELRRVFHDGPKWRDGTVTSAAKLPPLYPQG